MQVNACAHAAAHDGSTRTRGSDMEITMLRFILQGASALARFLRSCEEILLDAMRARVEARAHDFVTRE
jgi:hypothetical protein